MILGSATTNGAIASSLAEYGGKAAFGLSVAVGGPAKGLATFPRTRPGIARINVGDLPAAEQEVLLTTVDQIEGRLPAPATGAAAKSWGATHFNQEGYLPQQPVGYYHEYRVIPQGQSNAGALRVVMGQGGEMYYTWTHYGNSGTPAFVQIR